MLFTCMSILKPRRNLSHNSDDDTQGMMLMILDYRDKKNDNLRQSFRRDNKNDDITAPATAPSSP